MNLALTTIDFARKVAGAAFVIVNLSVMGTALAQDTTWKECELAEHDPERSITACSRLLSRPSTRVHAAAFHNRGVAWAAKENLDQAVSDISQGIRLDPQRAYRWQERGEIYTRQGKYPQAITDITEAIRLDPIPRAFRFHARAGAYRGLGDLTRAIADFDEALRLDPVARSFRFHDRGNALRDAGQYDRALADYETAAKLAPTDAWILLNRGRTYAKRGRSDVAKNDLHADFLSGYFAGIRRLQHPKYPAATFALTQFGLGDYSDDIEHHGTPDERGAAVVAGYRAGYDERLKFGFALESGIRYVNQISM